MLEAFYELDESSRSDLAYITASADMFAMLTLFLQFPTKDLLEGLLKGSIKTDLSALCKELALNETDREIIIRSVDLAMREAQSQEDALRFARQEYTRLFNHPESPAIWFYEALYLAAENEEKRPHELPRMFINRAALDAERCFKKSGMKRAEGINIPADCMATEMEFMYFLYQKKAQSLACGNLEMLEEIDNSIEEFVRLHVKKWGLKFFRSCQNISRTELYGFVGILGECFMSEQLAITKQNYTSIMK